MFEVSYESLRSRGFQQAFRKVMDCPGIVDIKASYNIARMGKLFDQEIKIANGLFIKLLKEYVEFTPEGQPKRTGDKWRIKEDVDEAAAMEAIEKFHQNTIKVERHKIQPEVIRGANLTPNDLLTLEPVLALD